MDTKFTDIAGKAYKFFPEQKRQVSMNGSDD